METNAPTTECAKHPNKPPIAVSDAHHADPRGTPRDGAVAADGASSEYICPMHPEVHATKPGACPKCGMALEAAATNPSSTKTEYVCPMHAQIVRDAPGACPICGMALEPRTVTAEETPNTELIDMRQIGRAHV